MYYQQQGGQRGEGAMEEGWVGEEVEVQEEERLQPPSLANGLLSQSASLRG